MEGENKEWQEYMGKDVMIKRISPGNGTIAEMKTIVKANIKVYMVMKDKEKNSNEGGEGEVKLTQVDDMRGASFQIGEGDAVPGLELALRHSSVGERLRVRCAQKFAYGAADVRVSGAAGGGDVIPAHSDLEFDVEVLEHVDLEENSGADLVRIEIATRKEAGNRWFTAGDFMRAGRCFTKGAQAAEKSLPSLATPSDHEGQPQAQSPLYLSIAQLYLDCLNNLAACHLSLKDPFKAREACIKVLEADPNNMRGLLRAGKASLGLHEYDESRLCFTSLLKMQQATLDRLSAMEGDGADPGSVAKATEDINTTEKWLKKLRRAEIEYKNRDRSIGKRISKGLFEGKDEIKADEVKKEKDTASPVVDVAVTEDDTSIKKEASDNNTVDSEQKLSTKSNRTSSRSESAVGDVKTKAPPAHAVDTASCSESDMHTEKSSRRGAVHPLVENLYTYQFYYYSAVLVASVAIGLQIF